MKLLFLCISIIAAVTPVSAENAAKRNSDHLAPVDRDDEIINKYRQVLTSKLSITRFDFGRVIIQPSFESESSVSIYSRRAKGGETYYVTYIASRANLWQQTRSARKIEAAQSVGIERIDAELPKPVAELVRDIWIRMLEDRRPRPVWLNMQGRRLEFSLERRRNSPVEAELWLPPPGAKTEALVRLVDSLSTYCQNPSSTRIFLAQKVERQARQLLSQLKSKE
jgi:hypothetical protein